MCRLNYFSNQGTGTLILCILLSVILHKNIFIELHLCLPMSSLSNVAFKAFILMRVINSLINTVEERIYQSSMEEHTQPLAQQHSVGLVAAQLFVHDVIFSRVIQ